MQARESKKFREDLWIACKRDLLFFCGAMLWTFDPRLAKGGGDPIVPFIPWPYQEEALLAIDEAIDAQHPLLIQKTRDMGVTWKVLVAMFRRWRFFPMQKFLLASRVEDLVDARGDSDSLFWKVDFLLSMLPTWMKPPIERTAMHLNNMENGSTFDGSSTNENLGRGGRRTAVMYDEFAAVQSAAEVHSASASLTDCPIYVSTHKGIGTRFYELSKSSMPKITLHWTRHPKKSEGLYYDEQGRPRSPWYDALQPIYGLTAQQIASEVDIDPEGSDFNFFDADVMVRLEKDHCTDGRRGSLDVDEDNARPLRWTEMADGGFFLWGPTPMGSPPADREYAIGVDIAGGTGSSLSSNSVICVGDCQTGEQVMEFAANNVLPARLARIAVAVARWYQGDDGQGAHIVWDSSGPGGGVFGQEVIALGYRNVYFKQREDSLDSQSSMTYGMGMNQQNKANILTRLKEGFAGSYGIRFVPRSRWLLRETRGYNMQNGKIEYTASKQAGDPSNVGAAHGDRVIAAALCWYRMRIRIGKRQAAPESRRIPVNSLAYRMQEVEAEEAETGEYETW